jgi:hypothetical protein
MSAIDLPPPTVTRFYGTVDYGVDVIRAKQIAFVHVSLLNDPFDPYCFFETDFEGKYPNLLRHVRKHHPNDIPWFRAEVTAMNWGKTVRELQEHLEKLRKHTFMLSTSAAHAGFHPKNNLYMWGHYGNGHRGLAIEFDTEKVATAVLKHHELENGAPLAERTVWSKVEYTQRFELIRADDVFTFLKQEHDLFYRKIPARVETNLDRYYRRMSIIKSDVWQNENEWRLMWRSLTATPSVYKCPISPDCIANIYIGLNFQGDTSALVGEVKHEFPNTAIFCARKRHGDLALDFDRQ